MPGGRSHFGDLAGDPYCELPALHLDGDGWEVPPDFAWRAMSMALLHEFDVLRGVGRAIDLGAAASPDALADRLWRLADAR